jgi:hypothetical protein
LYFFIIINDIDVFKLIEKRIIELISYCKQLPRIHVPKNNWLDYFHNNSIIPEAHIWNIQHAGGKFSENLEYMGAIER